MSGSYSRVGLLVDGLWVPPKEPPCSINPDAWSDAQIYSRNSLVQHEAIATCVFVCPYRTDCLEAAMKEEGSKSSQYRHGIRGGTLPPDRYREYKRRLLARKNVLSKE